MIFINYSEIITNALRHTEVHLNLAQYPTCPRLIRHVATTPGHVLPVHYDSMVKKNKLIYTKNNYQIIVKRLHFNPKSFVISPRSNLNRKTTFSQSRPCCSIRSSTRLFWTILCSRIRRTTTKESNFSPKKYRFAVLGWTIFIVCRITTLIFFFFQFFFSAIYRQTLLKFCLKFMTMQSNHTNFLV